MNHIFEQHKKWINIAKTFGADDLAEDFVQDSYIKILNKEKVNESFFYFVLRSTIADHFRKEKRECKFHIWVYWYSYTCKRNKSTY